MSDHIYINVFRCVSAPKTYISTTFATEEKAINMRSVRNADLEFVKMVKVKVPAENRQGAKIGEQH